MLNSGRVLRLMGILGIETSTLINEYYKDGLSHNRMLYHKETILNTLLSLIRFVDSDNGIKTNKEKAGN